MVTFLRGFFLTLGVMFAFVVGVELDVAKQFERKYEITGVVYSKDVNRNGWGVTLESIEHTKSLHIPLLLEHRQDPESILGVVTDVRIEGELVVFTAELTRTEANHVHVDNILRGYLKNISGGCFILKEDLRFVGEDFSRIITEMDLFEISVVTIPAEPKAIITEIKEL